jgi:hypothetical protein
VVDAIGSERVLDAKSVKSVLRTHRLKPRDRKVDAAPMTVFNLFTQHQRR